MYNVIGRSAYWNTQALATNVNIFVKNNPRFVYHNHNENFFVEWYNTGQDDNLYDLVSNDLYNQISHPV